VPEKKQVTLMVLTNVTGTNFLLQFFFEGINFAYGLFEHSSQVLIFVNCQKLKTKELLVNNKLSRKKNSFIVNKLICIFCF